MSIEMILLLYLVIGFITALAFYFLVEKQLTDNQLKELNQFIRENADYQSLAFIEVRCNQNPEKFFLKAVRMLLLFAGFLAPIGFYQINKELGTFNK